MLYNAFQFAWEVELMIWLQKYVVNTSFVTNLCVFFTLFGEPITAVFIISTLYWGIDKKMARFVAVNMFASNVMNPLIKNIFYRVRPYFVNEEIKCLKPVDSKYDIYDVAKQGYSFPSGHTMVATALYSSIYVYLKKRIVGIIVGILIILVGVSRFALGVHYPTDVIVGLLVSLMIVVLFTLLQKRFSQKKIMIISALIFLVGLLYCKTDDYYQNIGLYIGFIIADLYEQKYINFKNTRNILKIVIRTIVGCLIFYGTIEVMKIPFSDEFLHNQSFLSYLFMMSRYIVGVFVSMGIYPKLFKYNILKLDDKLKDSE